MEILVKELIQAKGEIKAYEDCPKPEGLDKPAILEKTSNLFYYVEDGIRQNRPDASAINIKNIFADATPELKKVVMQATHGEGYIRFPSAPHRRPGNCRRIRCTAIGIRRTLVRAAAAHETFNFRVHTFSHP